MKKFLIVCLFLMFSAGYVNSAVAEDTINNEYAKSIPVLIYHNVVKDSPKELEITANHFEKQMSFLKEHNYKTLTLDELYDFVQGNKNFPDRSVMLTFDDGLKSHYTYVYPILKRYGFTAVAFVVTSRIASQEDGYFLDTEEIENSKDVFEYASHTHDLHGQTIVAGVTDFLVKSKEEVIEDLKTSFKYVDKKVLAYPPGVTCTQELRDILKEIGIKMAFIGSVGNVYPHDPVYELKRMVIDDLTTDEQFMQIVGYQPD